MVPNVVQKGEVIAIDGEWWNSDPIKVEAEAKLSGGAPNVSDAFTINGQPGGSYNCSKSGTTNFSVEQGKNYLLRIVNAAVNNHLFFKVASHNLTVVAVDASYTKPYTTDILVLSSGQTADVLLTANQAEAKYYMTASVYTTQGFYDKTNTTAILNYVGSNSSATPIGLNIPEFNDTATLVKPCEAWLRRSIQWTYGHSSSLLLQHIRCLYHRLSFTSPVEFNYTGDVPNTLWAPICGTKVKVIEYNATVQVVFQGTNIFQSDNHPMHIHGYDFYIVGEGFGNYNESDHNPFNLVYPPLRNTVGVPVNGWVAIRFKADSPEFSCSIQKFYKFVKFDDVATTLDVSKGVLAERVPVGRDIGG
ncbi:laccase-12-like [Cryptomeria japonica]|uniref:laccase-12-like n=1 Tax=Cryptomeria japonica TaxID=3369 RepID=UPI0025ABFC3D|nr:laccase-12-like [Cryptomeria japonica]